LKAFAWKNLQQHFDAVVDKAPTRDGFYPVRCISSQSAKMPLQGEIDPTGLVFIGHFFPIGADYLERV